MIDTTQERTQSSQSLDNFRDFAFSQEEERLGVLCDLDLLDTPESESYDRITRMASRLFQAPVAAISLTDRNRQWFKSHVGTAGREIPREAAPCAEVTRSRGALVIPDLLEDSRFADSFLAKAGTRFYAGAPLTTRDGYVLGSMCVLDGKPRSVLPEDLASLHDFAAMVMSQIELQHDLGRIDPLSDLPNRNQLTDDISDMERREPGAPRIIVLVDFAGTDQFNDALRVLGTAYIDDLVKNASKAIKAVLGHKSGIYHIRTASFALLLEETKELLWQNVVNRLTEYFKTPLVCAGVPITIHASFGISPFLLGKSTPLDVLRTAMSAAHDARSADLGYAVYSPASDDANRRRFKLLTDVRDALVKPDQLALVYQPRVDARSGVCVGAEALLRWEHPTLGNIPPGEFIPLIEQTALARPITQWVVRTALKQVADWHKRSIDVRVSINISARNLEEEDFSQNLVSALQEFGMRPTAIELEFTESALIRNRSRVLAQLEEVRALGVEWAIDDFGTGYSTFSYLHKLPATTLKIDQSFIRTLSKGSMEETLVRSMISMAHDIEYRVVAEGVETAEIYRFLVESGCDELQGYFISRPLPVSRFEAWLKHDKDNQTIAMLGLLQKQDCSNVT